MGQRKEPGLSCIAVRDWDICLSVSDEYVTWYGTNSASLQAGQLAVPDQHVVLYVRAPAEGICRGSFDVCHTGSSIFLESCIDNKIH